MLFHSVPLLLCVTASLAACTPAYNWREVRLDGSPVVALLPCKPDEGRRSVVLGGQSLRMGMVGCEAGGATFAVARLDGSDGEHLAATLAAWKSATLANAHATAGPGTPFLPPGAIALQGAVRLSAQGQQSDGAPVALHVAWFAQGTQVYQALVVGRRVDTEAADTFFAGLRLP